VAATSGLVSPMKTAMFVPEINPEEAVDERHAQ
jgi:hypothetical protein